LAETFLECAAEASLSERRHRFQLSWTSDLRIGQGFAQDEPGVAAGLDKRPRHPPQNFLRAGGARAVTAAFFAALSAQAPDSASAAKWTMQSARFQRDLAAPGAESISPADTRLAKAPAQ